MRKRYIRSAALTVTAAALCLTLGSCGRMLDRTRSEGYAQGYDAGYDAGHTDGLAEGPDQAAYDKGYSVGLAESRDAAYAEGYDDGYAEAAAALTPPPPEEPAPDMDPTGFVELSLVAPDVILDIRYYSTYNFVGERIDGYSEPVALVTAETAVALRVVSDELAEKGYRLIIYDAYRPQSAVDHFILWSRDADDARMKAYFYPDEDKAALFEKGYISERSGHSRGSTVDVSLFDVAAGRPVDMGGTFDLFGAISHADATEGLTKAQIANRALLRDTMTAHGFTGIDTEWWHFTLTGEPFPDTYFNFPVGPLD